MTFGITVKVGTLRAKTFEKGAVCILVFFLFDPATYQWCYSGTFFRRPPPDVSENVLWF